MIPTSVHLAPRCGLGTKVPRPMANLGGQESLVVLLERKDGPEKLAGQRSEEHTSELQSRGHLVCRLLLEKKKKTKKQPTSHNNKTHQTPTSPTAHTSPPD